MGAEQEHSPLLVSLASLRDSIACHSVASGSYLLSLQTWHHSEAYIAQGLMVVSSVGIAFGGKGKVPCLCLVAREPAFLATGLDVHKILEMYHVCYGALPVDSHTGDSCQG